MTLGVGVLSLLTLHSSFGVMVGTLIPVGLGLGCLMQVWTKQCAFSLFSLLYFHLSSFFVFISPSVLVLHFFPFLILLSASSGAAHYTTSLGGREGGCRCHVISLFLPLCWGSRRRCCFRSYPPLLRDKNIRGDRTFSGSDLIRSQCARCRFAGTTSSDH